MATELNTSNPALSVILAAKEFDLKPTFVDGVRLWLDRDSMVNANPRLGEEEAYAATLDVLRGLYPRLQMWWIHKNDDALLLEIFSIDGQPLRA